MSRPFRLAGLLRVRGIQERAAAAHLSRSAMERSHTDARERQLRAALAASADIPIDVRTLAAVAAGRVAARSTLTDLRTLADMQLATLEDARAQHAAARIDQRGLARLAEAHADRETARELHEEQIELDEIAVRTHTEESP
ncbi:hypothetical protein NQ166_10510 [Microbacterium sp. zg.Y1090]|uniref:hypothetical protein n=1 Tax=Microbacterium TaxID=33882 RepID=UPI00214BD460|nr:MULTISPECIES: hypothetical protein [unclassified Microbacterium]MCR2813982.1 hypothetical protein [Microbacterium sp. zg.Y1084]MCR2819256.1 hypothetical protein [Microbacterium sp. zg.Y1090]MDL5487173.1 hypothetical protein [Microbacterium sp. zg-Y1211]WIM28238.1 hypothetical protein QNO26_14010 [Microbacterium sp. zg-Y1090]